MSIFFNSTRIPIFNLLGIKNKADANFYSEFINFIKKTEDYQFDGILLPDSNAGILNPWFFANTVFSISHQLTPFIAINPLYTHPFFTAKYISNLSCFADRALFLNYITGTAVFDSSNLGDKSTHDSKYERLEEYIQSVDQLLSKPSGAHFEGKYYNIKNIDFPGKLAEKLLPQKFVAGSSSASLQVIKKTSSSRLSMAMPLDNFKALNQERDYNIGFHFGILSRETGEEAEIILNNYCPANETVRKIKEFSIQKTGIIWKKELLENSYFSTQNDCYNLAPFLNGCSDVPYLTGSYENVAHAIYNYLLNGLGLMVIEIPDTGHNEFYHVDRVFSTLQQLILLGH